MRKKQLKTHTLEQFQNLIENIAGRDKIDSSNTEIHVFSLTRLGIQALQ